MASISSIFVIDVIHSSLRVFRKILIFNTILTHHDHHKSHLQFPFIKYRIISENYKNNISEIL